MNSKNVELEVVQFKAKDIGYVTTRLINDFAQYSGVVGTKQWPKLWYQAMTLIRDQIPFNCIWEAGGVDINLSFFLEPRLRVIDGKLIYSTPEPRISFIERPETVRPAVRTHISRVTGQIAQEMQDVYRLRIERDPLVLVFPKQEYASRVDRFTVPLIAA